MALPRRLSINIEQRGIALVVKKKKTLGDLDALILFADKDIRRIQTWFGVVYSISFVLPTSSRHRNYCLKTHILMLVHGHLRTFWTL